MQIIALFASLLASILIVAYGQEVNQTYVSELFAGLKAHDYTSFARALQDASNSTEGASLLSALSDSNDKLVRTVFVPTNDAFALVPTYILSNTTLLANVLSYHVLNASLSPIPIANDPTHSIARSLYNNGMLPGNHSQVVVYNLIGESKEANQTLAFPYKYSASVNALPLKVANLMIYPIRAVLSLPQDIYDLARTMFPSFREAVDKSNLLYRIGEAKGVTIFAPNDDAMEASAYIEDRLNFSQIQTLLSNHVINGSVAYSPLLASSNYISAAGEPFKFITNATGSFVTSGNATAKIVTADIPIENGVVHIIDRVLINPDSNTEAAESAVLSYAAQATATSSGLNEGVIVASPTAATSAKASSAAVLPSPFSFGVFGSAVAIFAGILAGNAFL
ncbi:hypothetical protein QFC22_003903 [Naganishia vaughanmartiniae]|uniref:Uncharacterized protein n=1 Tax=Naganishia vaughanmartiniae TaxID=1424756 RepID=A0ACC2X4N1_9TREE|nr:hypothetical protein QFC22_003903 [Naganishia vaughanmartiniae]